MYKNIIIKLIFTFSLLNMPAAYSNEANKQVRQNQNKGTVLITGANRGLGLALSKHFIADGYHVIGTARKPQRAAELKNTGAQVEQLDVVDDDSIAALAQSLKGVPIDILVNNAGYIASLDRGLESFKNTSRKDFLYTYNVNVIGPVMVTRALLPNLLLAKSDVKKVVNISSHGGIVDRPNVPGIYSYDPTKTALNKITVDLSKDLKAYQIAVIALAPGHNKTRMGGESGKLQPDFSMGKAHKVITGLSLEDTGSFVGYSGFSIKW
ncbi:SDR family oxidoreductase [Catenovulum sediminis]|uniref:SDR family oxidoreductase n=1 Tax=Catenovulum sediminis TaxID=1740262 RepID=A0ABV1RLS6_9ALTE|nr:SDR family oxidoreductase [Catenovulum sediminis]